MKNKFIVAILVLGICTSFIACGKKDNVVEKENILAVHDIVNQFNASQKEVYDEIDYSETNLSSMIVKELTNPNTAPDSGSGDPGTPIVETKYINDKNVRSIGYGFVINGVAMTLAGVILVLVCGASFSLTASHFETVLLAIQISVNTSLF